MTNIINLKKNNNGFTIIELLIATATLSVILILATIIITSIGSLFTQGINQSRVQDSVRSTVDEIAQNLQFTQGFSTDDGSDPKEGAYCIGNTRYTYEKVDGQMGDPLYKYQHVLWRDKINNIGSCSPVKLKFPSPTFGGVDLAPARSRLTVFNISGNSPYVINVGIAIGSDDLLCDSNTPNDCSSITISTNII
ncbi:MAG TPA: prepilin-type N-terminal cleavage/methylation domain-containing protein, partial [Patescibacteria group bacterium]|nr:prepilin-type N-terminal cleavage/methylation domain-containing protein [Patescibacteria group bacterium]